MIDSFDWIEDFEHNFNNNPGLATIKKDRFYGKLEINFEAGVSKTVNFNRHIKADMPKP
jgi:hypothetical protein